MQFLGRKLATLLVLCAVLTLPFVAVYSAGGRIEGKVTDPKGAAVVDASITVTDEANGQTFTAVTDAQGVFKVEGLPAGNYVVVVAARGFNDARNESVKVAEGASVPLTFQLVIAAIEAAVNVSATSLKPNTDPLYQRLRQQSKTDQDFSGPYASVSNVVLNREGAGFTLRSGEIYFLEPVEGRYTGAVFLGDGQLNLIPPIDAEKNSLKLFTDEPALNEQFSHLVLRFTDKTFDEIKNSPGVKMMTGGAQASRARDLFRENQTLLRKRLRDNGELRVLADLYTPGRPGFFTAFINGKRFSKLVFLFNPLGVPEVYPEEVLLFSYGDTDGGYWTAFHRPDEYKKGTASSAEDHRQIDILKHDIEGTITGAHLTAKDRFTFKALVPQRIVLLNLYRTLRVKSVQDEQGKDLNFIQEGKDEDADLGIIMPNVLEAGKTYTLTIQYDGADAIRDSGGGNFILIPRLSWYPNNASLVFGDRAIFDMTFRYPKGFTFVGTGAPVEAESRAGDQLVAKWSSGTTELAVAGFNYGRFKKKELLDKQTGYNIEFYANLEVPNELKAAQFANEQAERDGVETFQTLGVVSTTRMADAALADAQNATRIFQAFFGKLPYSRVAMTQQPAANFGQAWPTLVFMPYTAFIDTTQRTQMFGVAGGTSNFWRYVGPHEVAHQWWGHTIGWHSYRDQWMSEGFAELSASLYVQYVRRDLGKFNEFWEDQRKLIVEATPATRGRKPYTVGPITQGNRLNSGKTGGVSRFLLYPKGAYVLHMIRMMMYDDVERDVRFQTMMKDFVKTHYNQNISTEDFKKAVEKYMTPEMDVMQNKRMDWFFNKWVYGTEIPAYTFDYQLSKDGTLTAKLTQSGVSDDFVMLVPIYVDYGKGWSRLGMARMVGNTSADLSNVKLPMPAKRAAICVYNDVLATSIQQKTR